MNPTVQRRGRCPVCKKVRYLTRRDARTIRRTIYRNVPGMRAYPCGDYYHVGQRRRDKPTTGADPCRDSRKKHYPTNAAAHEYARPCVARNELPPTYQVKRCACGGGWVILRVAPAKRPRGAAA